MAEANTGINVGAIVGPTVALLFLVLSLLVVIGFFWVVKARKTLTSQGNGRCYTMRSMCSLKVAWLAYICRDYIEVNINTL